LRQSRQQQREISAEVQTGCQQLLHESFAIASDEKGAGSHGRRKAIVERGAEEARYEKAVVGIVRGISSTYVYVYVYVYV